MMYSVLNTLYYVSLQFLTALVWFLTFFLFNLIIQIVHWRNHLKFPEDTQLSVDAIDLMTRLLCDAEHRAGVDQIKVAL